MGVIGERVSSMQTKLACGAAVIVDNHIILLKRKRHPEAGHWALPAGKVHFDEQVSDAACREVREELGISIAADVFLCNHPFEDYGANIRWLAHIYYSSSYEGTPQNMEPDKHEDICWFSLGNLPDPLSCFVRVALSVIYERKLIYVPSGVLHHI